jgi:ATP-dependent Clp protease adaptor protein ClpS
MRRREVPDSDRMVYEMDATKIKRTQSPQTGTEVKPDLPWNVILHNDWENAMPQVVLILKKVIPGMTFKKATKIMWEAHTTGKALVKSCHKELAELYEERLLAEGLTVSIEPAG